MGDGQPASAFSAADPSAQMSAASAGPSKQQPTAGSDGNAQFKPPARVEEEYVVLTEQGPPITALAKARNPSSGGTDFCGNLARIAYALEEMALKRLEQFPSDALAL